MPLFLSDEEFALCGNDVTLVSQKADAFIRDLYKELDTVKARADAASITAEQTCSILEQKYVSLSEEFERAEAKSKQLEAEIDRLATEVAAANAEKHRLHLQSIGKDGDIERLTTEVAELHKSKRQLLELVERKDLEISEKNSTIKSYLDKIVKLTETTAQKDTRVHEIEAELARSLASCERLSREKELLERHISWLNDELSAKVDNYNELRKTHSNLEANLSAKLKDAERQLDECLSSLNFNKERVRDLEMRVTSLQEELYSTRDAASATEERLSAELSTVNKLVELYKESSAEWSKKAGELEGVIKALELQLNQTENEYKEKLDKEMSLRKHFEEEAANLMGKLQKCEAEMENSRKANEQSLLPLRSPAETWLSYESNDIDGDSDKIVPKIPPGVSGTALAASLLRDGWSLAKMYSKYQEAVDAFRHEQMGRKEAEAVLQRVLHELEEKAGMILDERAEHDRMVEAYAMLDQRLQLSVSEQANLERTIRELKAELKKSERESNLGQKEIADLQKQVTILLKECRDIQLRCGSTGHDTGGDSTAVAATEESSFYDAHEVISERLLTFKDINGLVEQNVQLRGLVRSLSDQISNNEIEFKEKFEIELKKHTDEAANKVAAVMQRAEEQTRMIEALHTSVAMYKRLYEEEHKLHSNRPQPSEHAPENGRKDLALLLEGSQMQEATKKAQEQASGRIKCLEEELANSRSDISSLRSERDRLALEAKFSKERLDSFVKEFEHQREQMNGVLARNVEFSQLIIDHQRKLRESSESLQAAEEHTRKLSMEVSVMKHEKEMLVNAEKRACDEVRNLTERVYRLQASLDTIQSAEEVREEARVAERRKQEEYIKQLEREWAEAKKELQDERDNVRNLTLDREQTLKNAMRQVEDIGKDLTNALRAVSMAETRAAVAEAKLSDMEKKIKSSNAKLAVFSDIDGPSSISSNEVLSDLQTAKEEIDKLREEVQVNKDHMLQYKNIAEVNEVALKQMESAHENFKNEAEKQKKSLEDEIQLLNAKLSDLENVSNMKSVEVASTSAAKEEELASALSEKSRLIEEISEKTSQLSNMEIQITSLKEDLEKEHERWRTAQANYERQVVLQSETIQELTKTSQALALLQDEASELRKLADKQKTEINELKVHWETEKSVLEISKNEAEKKYEDLNEQNKILHDRLEALHIKLAEKDRSSAGSASSELLGDAGLQNVIGYLRRSKEIAETEISLLKQEKLRLQSQLESALKAAETAKSSLDVERANSRTLLFTNEEIKSLQLQVREINLLRESNLQLREENKHNFEECEKLRELAQQTKVEKENLENLFNERQMEIEGYKKEIEKQRMEKELLEKRIHELLERSGNISVEDFDRMKDNVQQMQGQLRDKDAQINEIKSLLSREEEKISRLEQDLTNSRVELNEREKRINNMLQTEAKTKGDLDRQRKLLITYKKRIENLTKEKDEMSKENQALSKQLEELKQGRSVGVDNSEQTKKENEKDTRIKILEKHMEKLREDLRKEKEDIRNEKGRRLKSEKTIKDSFNILEQDKMKLVNELEKHKQALKRLSEELEKLKVAAKNNLPQGTSVLQLLSSSALDDNAARYASAFENFERTAKNVLVDLGGRVLAETSTSATAAVATPSGLTIPQDRPVVPSKGTGASSGPAKSTEEGEKKFTVPKPNVETRKPGRRLNRPRLVRPEEPQADTKMSEMERPSIGEKPVPTHETEVHGTQPVVRKRVSESHTESNAEGDASADILPPALKKSKGSDTAQEGEGTSALASESVGTPPREESSDIADMPQGDDEDAMDADREGEEEEEETPEEKVDDIEEQEQLDSTGGAEAQKDKDVSEGNVEKGNETDEDDEIKGPDEQDNQQPNEGEEGEMMLVTTDIDGIETPNPVESLEAVDAQTEPVSTPAVSPLRTDDGSLADQAGDAGETNSPEASQDEKNEEGEIIEGAEEDSDKSDEGIEPNAIESEPMPKSTPASDGITSTAATDSNKQSSSSVTAVEDLKPSLEEVKPPVVTPGAIEEKSVGSTSTSTTINLQERARQRAALRQAGVVTPPVNRGRGRAVLRGRVRGRGRGGRGQPSNEQS